MKTIMIIEDEEKIRSSLELVLKMHNYKPLSAADGEEGLKLIKEALPDLVLCDINMPKLSGYEVLREIRQSLPEYQQPGFIMLSAKIEREDVRKAMALGALDYITKPFIISEVIEAIETQLKKKEKYVASLIDEERKRMSQELHNNVQQIMAMAKLSLTNVLNDLDSEALSDVYKNIGYSKQLLDMAIRETRLLSHRLIPKSIQQGGISAYIDKIKEILEFSSDMTVTYERMTTERFSAKFEHTVCLMIQELISNTVKYAPGCDISLLVDKISDEELLIEYKDSGPGFDPQTAVYGAGIKLLKENIRKTKGSYHLETAEGQGTKHIIKLPITNYSKQNSYAEYEKNTDRRRS